MSYILDALRKSDLQRQRGAAPTLLTTHVAAEPPQQPPLLLYGLVAMALVATGMVIGWLQPWQAQQPAPAPDLVIARPPVALPRQNAPARSPVTLDTVHKPEREPPARKAGTAPQPAAASAPAIIETPGVLPATPAGISEKVPEMPGTRPADATHGPRVMSLSELPPAIQQSIPRMAIAVHAYSPKAQDRVVMINNRMLREGQEVASGLRLEQITPEGMILSFGGYRFRRGVQPSGDTADMK